MTEKVVLGIDIGTTSVKVAAYDLQKNMIFKDSNRYVTYRDYVDMAEQSPEEIMQALLKTLGKVIKFIQEQKMEIISAGFSSAMHSLILLDEKNKLLTNMLTWADNRSAKSVKKINEMTKKRLYEKTAVPVHAMTPFSKCLWLKEIQSDLYYKAKKFLGIKEYIILQLFDIFVMDVSSAGATGMMNIEQLGWDTEILASLSLKEGQLPQIVATNTILPSLKKEYVKILGIEQKIPFVIGSSDGCLANLGVDAIEKDTLVITMGTSGAVRLTNDAPIFSAATQLFSYQLFPEKWIIGGATNNAGNVLEWAAKLVSQLTKTAYSVEKLIELAMESTPMANGLFFLPYLNGERAPIWDADAKGVLYGLSLYHTPADIARAVVEGIMMNIIMIYQEIAQHNQVVKIYFTGGLSQNKWLCQLLANMLQQNIYVKADEDSSCLGAAIISLPEKEFQFVMAAKKIDQQAYIADKVFGYQSYQDLYHKISKKFAQEFSEIADFQRNLFKEDKK